MSDVPDDELKAWMTDWQAEAGPAPEVRQAILRRVRRRSRQQGAFFAVETAVALASLAFLGWFFSVERALPDRALAVALMLTTLFLLGFGAWNYRRTWRPSGDTTAAFLELSRLRCRRQIRAVRVGVRVAVVMGALYVPWIGYRAAGSAEPLATLALGAVLLVGLLGPLALLLRRWGRRNEVELRGLETTSRWLVGE